MNRFIMHISWIDAQIVSRTLDSIQNALQYSTEPTEFIFFLNEQTVLDTPLEKTPKECWEHFIHHPFMEKVQVIYKTNDDPPFGVSVPRIKDMIRDGVNYWGESDCYLPKEYFFVSEQFHKRCPLRPYILTFSERKMWPGWEWNEHEAVRHETPQNLESDPERKFLCCDQILSLEKLYEFNKACGPDIKIERIPDNLTPGQDNIFNSTLLVLSENMPQNLICPDLIMTHEDYCLQWSRKFYRIPVFHVTNVLKGHDNYNPIKRTNIALGMSRRSDALQDYHKKEGQQMGRWLQNLDRGELIK